MKHAIAGRERAGSPADRVPDGAWAASKESQLLGRPRLPERADVHIVDVTTFRASPSSEGLGTRDECNAWTESTSRLDRTAPQASRRWSAGATGRAWERRLGSVGPTRPRVAGRGADLGISAARRRFCWRGFDLFMGPTMKLLPENELACRPRAGIDSWERAMVAPLTRRFRFPRERAALTDDGAGRNGQGKPKESHA